MGSVPPAAGDPHILRQPRKARPVPVPSRMHRVAAQQGGLLQPVNLHRTGADQAGQRILQLPVAYEGIELLSDDFLARAHAAGLMVWVWPNDAAYENVEEYRRFFDRGLDGVNANRPSEAVAARNGFADGSQ